MLRRNCYYAFLCGNTLTYRRLKPLSISTSLYVASGMLLYDQKNKQIGRKFVKIAEGRGLHLSNFNTFL